ncbi:MAG TPA: hypothetical protein P5048_00920 [Chlamydiales bacterium]|nr:hypothetical protein [Chlamydiales bacterium]
MRAYSFFLVLGLCFFSSLAAEVIEEEKLVTGLTKVLLDKGVKKIQKDDINPTTPVVTKKLTVDLKNPVYQNGILYTREGGVIYNQDLHIQANVIQYTRRMENGQLVHKIEAEGNLLLQYKNRIFIGDELEYNFETKSGYIYGGKTKAGPWYLGGEKIKLFPCGNYKVENVSITTCERKNSAWDIHALRMNMVDQTYLDAKDVKFRLFKFPTFWLPSFHVNLKKFFQTPLIRYKLNWDKSAGPKVSMRYRVYSWKDFALFLRGEYRLKKGLGGAIETEYLPEDSKTSFITRSYLASDVLPKDPKKKQRYRIQGHYQSFAPDNKTSMFVTWDKYSDIRMPADFKSDDFEIHTGKKTEAYVHNLQDHIVSYAHARFKANPFETIKQDYPTIYYKLHPLQLGKSKIITENSSSIAYLDYSYSDDISPELTDFSSWRCFSTLSFYRSFPLKGFTLTPIVKGKGIYYSDSPKNTSQLLGSLSYGVNINASMHKNYLNYRHFIRPYLDVMISTAPTVKNEDIYIFSIQDGFHRINELKIGLLNQLYKHSLEQTLPSFQADLYTYAFFSTSYLKDLVPRGYLDLKWSLPTFDFGSDFSWNFLYNSLDYSNFNLQWTINEDIAFNTEFRFRSSKYFRKADKDNFILDVTRSEEELLRSPLSDKRNTLLFSGFFRLTPNWSFKVTSHHGWNRTDEKGYNEFKIDFFSWLSSTWKLRLSYQHTQTDDRFTWALNLVK